MDDTAAPINLEVQDFIWKGLNQYYLWQPDVPNLSDDRFASQNELNALLRTYPVPEELFDALRVDKSIDRFSWIVDDYFELEVRFKESQKNSGVEFGLVYKPGSNTDILVMFVTSFLVQTQQLKTFSVVLSFTVSTEPNLLSNYNFIGK
jgi:hypothetical protein